MQQLLKQATAYGQAATLDIWREADILRELAHARAVGQLRLRRHLRARWWMVSVLLFCFGLGVIAGLASTWALPSGNAASALKASPAKTAVSVSPATLPSPSSADIPTPASVEVTPKTPETAAVSVAGSPPWGPTDKKVSKNLTKPVHSEKVPSATNSQPQRRDSAVPQLSPTEEMASPLVIME